jgi:hypothetical protein
LKESPKSYVVFGCVISAVFLKGPVLSDEAVSHDLEIRRHQKIAARHERCSK